MNSISQIPVIVLAGGFGTRLRSVVDLPKPIAPVRNRPFLDYVIRSLYRQGARHLIFSLFYESQKIIEAIQSQTHPADLKLSFVIEPEAMGTGGAVKYAYEKMKLSSAVFVCNGDTYFEKGLREIFDPVHSCLGLLRVEDASRYGRVLTDPHHYIDSFQEKDGVNGPALINMGLYFLTPEFLQQMPTRAHSIEKDVFEKLQGQKKLKGLEVKTYFIDIGIPEDYQRFQKEAPHE